MARGDQRERDRAKKQARLAKDAKGGAKVSVEMTMCMFAKKNRVCAERSRDSCVHPGPIASSFFNSVGGPDSLEY